MIFINKSCGVRFVDFVNVFDITDHYFLLRRKSVYGLFPETLFKSFPADRKQTVYENAATSDVRFLKYGVPKGSDLGPRLISIYINDLPQFIKACCGLFADDTANHYWRVSTVY